MCQIITHQFWNKDKYFDNENLVVKVYGIKENCDCLDLYDFCLIDVDLAELIVLLNLKGLHTAFSCSGILRNHKKDSSISGYILFNSNIPKTLVDKINDLGCFVIKNPTFIRIKDNLTTDDQKISAWKKLYDLIDPWQKQQELVRKFIKPEKIEGLDWAREIKIANKLLKIKEINFWRDFVLNFKLNSLCFFLSGDGKSSIIKYDNERKFEKSIEESKN